MTPQGWHIHERRWQDRFIAWGARYITRRLLQIPQPWALHRVGFALAGAMRRPIRGVKVQRVPMGNGYAIIYQPKAPKRRICWFHGGGFVVGSPRTHAAMLSRLAVAADATVIAPSYRRAPEHPFPAAADDAIAAIDAVWDYDATTGPLIIGGDSAGGALALGAMAHMLQQGRRPHACLLASPATWMDPDRPVPPSHDLLFPLSLLRRIGRDYGAGHDPNDPKLSPRFADFPNAPPTLIHCVRGEYLEQDSDLIADRLRHFAAPVTVQKAEGVPHVWHFMGGLSPMADDATARMANFTRHPQ